MKTKIVIVLLALTVIAGGVGCSLGKITEDTGAEAAAVSTGVKLTLPEKMSGSKFGFLSAGEGDGEQILARGARWVRPHPGAFLWDRTQKSVDSAIDFTDTDTEVVRYQKDELGILVTLWPFAEWEQGARAECSVGENDEFLAKNDKKGRIDYLPLHRCNPTDWTAYAKWVAAVVERYDGDGVNDMEGLKYPIKHWEVMNEPDLTSPAGEPSRLDFYQGTPADYAKLLIETSAAVKTADADAQILIAGAAGGSDQFLDFYREVLKQTGAIDAFDIGNVHCISNDSYDSFNLEPYQKMLLSEFGINKPIWITEAESMFSSNADVNATQALSSTQKALSLGAARIFYTQYEFIQSAQGMMMPRGNVPTATDLPGSSATDAYKTITSQ